MRIPSATYRLQFNKNFTFCDAAKIVPYLAALGISHCYASPILRARPGSLHGYDIIDHRRLNPEIGSTEDFDVLIAELHKHNMGLIADFVPNHMGIGKENSWWMDVLENGPASPYAPYFDIDWEPIRKELYGKVLIPVLGSQYGEVLKNGELVISFDLEKGALVLNYYEHSFPINPVSYPQVLGLRVQELRTQLGDDNFDLMEYLSILSALERLPDHLQAVGHAQRVREKKVQMKRLAMLCIRNSAIAQFIRSNLTLFQVENSDEQAMHRLHQLLECQAYRLAFWRVASDEINYRRFFDVNELAAIRTEDLRVFNDIHSFTLDLVEQGKLDGLRIDHPDGLFDPPAYFKRLQTACARRLKISFDAEKHKGNADGGASLPMYVVAEKILAPYENFEEAWMVQGTTGYEFVDSLNNLIVAEENEDAFNEIYAEFTGSAVPYEIQKRQCKNLILRSVLASELNMLAQRLDRIAESNLFYRDFTLSSLRRAIREVVAYFPVYRTYANFNGVDKTARQYIDWAVTLATRNSDIAAPVFEFIRGVLAMDLPAEPGDISSEREEHLWHSVATFAMKFQQFTGPVTAKSVEDTLFYRYNRLVCLNEVGGEPKRFGTSVSSFHHQNNLRQQRTPYGLLSSSTHDTKRSEDVRARLAVLSEIPDEWRSAVFRWTEMNEPFKTTVNDEVVPSRNDEYLLFQTIVGAFPLSMLAEETPSDDSVSSFCARMADYMIKAMREAKAHTSWVQQNSDYENAVTGYINQVLSPQNLFLTDVQSFVRRICDFGLLNSLSQTLLKLTSPGVPDIYQGNEIWDFSLVDPDNRRAVDFASRHTLLESIETFVQDLVPDEADANKANALKKMFDSAADGLIKLLLTAIGLRTHTTNPRLFDAGEYIPLPVNGSRAAHVVAFARSEGPNLALIAAPIKIATLNRALQVCSDTPAASPFHLVMESDTWTDTVIQLPSTVNVNWAQSVFSGRRIDATDQQIFVSDLFKDFPLALLLTQAKA